MIDNEIIKALECCSVGTFACDEQCPCFHSKSNLKVSSCRFELIGDALDLINRQKAEIERLTDEREKLLKECKRCGRKTQKVIVKLQKKLKTAKAEAIKELAERLRRYIDVGHLRPPTEICFSELDVVNMIDNLVKEMVGDAD